MADARTRPLGLEIEMTIQGMEFPALRQAVLDYARNQGASQSLIDVLNKIPETVYDSSGEVMREVVNLSNLRLNTLRKKER